MRLLGTTAPWEMLLICALQAANLTVNWFGAIIAFTQTLIRKYYGRA